MPSEAKQRKYQNYAFGNRDGSGNFNRIPIWFQSEESVE